MKGFSSEILGTLRATLCDCPEFKDMRLIRSVFDNPQLQTWKADLPEGTSLTWRVNLTISYLMDKQSPSGDENALAVLLYVLSKHRPSKDKLRHRLVVLAEQVAAWDKAQHSVGRSALSRQRRKAVIADIVILTVLPEEYEAVYLQLDKCHLLQGTRGYPNLYAWRHGRVFNSLGSTDYQIVVGMIRRAGTSQSSLATMDAIQSMQPRYVFFVGIAGGFGDLVLGDVVIADTIYGYEYGKVEKTFSPRHEWIYKTDLGLLTGTESYALTNDWRKRIKVIPPQPYIPKIRTGIVASGDKVVDNPSNEFFAQVRQAWPKIKAVEMEGAGVGLAIEHAHAKGVKIGFMMIRGISDLPRSQEDEVDGGSEERDKWKRYAAETAASFALGYIANGLPIPPRG